VYTGTGGLVTGAVVTGTVVAGAWVVVVGLDEVLLAATEASTEAGSLPLHAATSNAHAISAPGLPIDRRRATTGS
jgi:hypothetical protein